MQSVKLNLKDVPSVKTHAKYDKKGKVIPIPKTTLEFQETLSSLGETLLVEIINKKNPAYHEMFSGDVASVHEALYNEKQALGATKPNYTSRGENPKKPLPPHVPPRVKANEDYEVLIMADEYSIKYKFNEDKIVQELQEYINSTYDQHYSKNNFQATEFIIDGGHGTGFCIGNVLKYAQRYGKKGSPADARKDLMKVLHYATIAIDIHDQEHKDQ